MAYKEIRKHPHILSHHPVNKMYMGQNKGWWITVSKYTVHTFSSHTYIPCVPKR